MKKLLSVVLVLAMLLGLSAGVLAEEKKSTWLTDEKTTLTVTTYDGVSAAFPTIGNDLRVWQWLEEYTNVHIEWEVHSRADYGTVTAAKLASGQIETDIFNVANATLLNQAGAAGVFVDLTPYLETCAPHLIAYNRDVNPRIIPSSKSSDGKQYYMGGSVSPDIGHIVYMYNTEWLKKLGREVPTTLDEFYDLCNAIKGQDLNGNGQPDEIVLTSSSLGAIDIMGNTFGLEHYEGTSMFAAKDGVVYSEHVADQQREYLTYLNKLFEEGILDPAITNHNADLMSQKIAADQVGIFIYYSAFAVTYGRLSTAGQADPLGEHYTMGGPLKGPHGHQYYVLRDRPTNDVTGVSASSKNVELAIRWLDTLINDPAVILTRTSGWEGEHYEFDENGNVKLIYDADGNWDIKPLGCGQLAMPHYQSYDHMMNGLKHISWYMEQYHALLEPTVFIAPSVPPTNTYTVEEQDKIDMVAAECKDYFNEMRAKFITGEADIETEWDDYVATMYNLGLQDWIDAMQSYYDRAVAN
jgi:putative aldouronate transport system substrate-binding protein